MVGHRAQVTKQVNAAFDTRRKALLAELDSKGFQKILGKLAAVTVASALNPEHSRREGLNGRIVRVEQPRGRSLRPMNGKRLVR